MRCLCQTSGMSSSVRPLLLLDSASLYYRSFHALPESMTAPDGRPHNALRGFLSTLARLVGNHSPAAVVAAWDDDWRPAWRVELIPGYKAHRVAADGSGPSEEAEPESLPDQAEAIAEVLVAAGIPVVGVPDYEADDVLASLAKQDPRPAIVVSGDRDLVQLVDERTRLLLTVNGGMDKWPLLDPEGVTARFGVPPESYVDLAVLRGDPSDGLPGVKGIGAKTAVALVLAFGDLDAILAAAVATPDRRPLTRRLAAALTGSEDEVRRALRVATAVTDLPVLPLTAGGDPDRLHVLASRWGVMRQVDDLMAARARSDAAGA